MADDVRVVEVFADVGCPFAHFSLRRFVDERARRGADHVRLRVRAWPLEWINGTPWDPAAVAEEVADLRRQVCPELFGGFDPAVFPTSTIAALGACTLAYRHGLEAGEAFNLAVREALFEASRRVDDPAVLQDVAARCGVTLPDPEEVERAVRADLEEGRRRGVVGSPHFFVDGEGRFCPLLDIRREGDRLHIRLDTTATEALARRAFG